MANQLLQIQRDYLKKLYDALPDDMEEMLPAQREGRAFRFQAFGEPCSLSSEGILLSGEPVGGPVGVLIALYAHHASREAVQLEPVKSFKQIKGSMPYQGAFSARSQQGLVPHVEHIRANQGKIVDRFSGQANERARGDFSFTLYPLPKIPLYYIFYLADEEFPASVTCLFASNAERFMPVDGLADVGEYTAKKMIQLVGSEGSGG